jgi:hypothetical protein
LCERYNVSPRTIYRWIDAGILPQPININNRLFFDNDALEQKERERMQPNRKLSTAWRRGRARHCENQTEGGITQRWVIRPNANPKNLRRLILRPARFRTVSAIARVQS